MKTKELIRLLRQCDPLGEEEVFVDNVDILSVHGMPAYYDGPAQQLVRDETNPDYNVVGGIYRRSGAKIQIHLCSFDDALLEDPELPIDVSGVSDWHKEKVEAWRRENRKVIAKVEAWRKENCGAADKAAAAAQDAEHTEKIDPS